MNPKYILIIILLMMQMSCTKDTENLIEIEVATNPTSYVLVSHKCDSLLPNKNERGDTTLGYASAVFNEQICWQASSKAIAVQTSRNDTASRFSILFNTYSVTGNYQLEREQIGLQTLIRRQTGIYKLTKSTILEEDTTNQQRPVVSSYSTAAGDGHLLEDFYTSIDTINTYVRIDSFKLNPEIYYGSFYLKYLINDVFPKQNSTNPDTVTLSEGTFKARMSWR